MELSQVARSGRFSSWAVYLAASDQVRDDGPDQASDGEWEEGEEETITTKDGRILTFIH